MNPPGNPQSNTDQNSRQHLGHPDSRNQIQTVCPQSFNETPYGAVANQIKHGHPPILFDSPCHDHHNDKKDQICCTFIKKCGLVPFLKIINIYTIREKLQVRIRDQISKSLLVGKISPPADNLSQQQTWHSKVHQL